MSLLYLCQTTPRVSVDSTITQLTRDLKESIERETSLKDQLDSLQNDFRATKKKLIEADRQNEVLQQRCSMRSAKMGIDVGESSSEREAELKGQLELAEQDLRILRKKMDEIQQDNENLLCAVKYLRSKMESKSDGAR